MPSQYSNLKIELMETGQNNNQWGNITNTNLGTALEQAIVGMATIETGDFTTNVATLTLANTNALQDARALCLNVTATLTGAGTINVPAIQKPYVIFNNTSGGYAVTVKVSGQTGVSVPNGKKTVVYNNGTDVGEQITFLNTLQVGTLTLVNPLAVAQGGTGAATLTGLVKGNGTSAMTVAVAGTDYVTPSGTETLSNKTIQQRVVVIADATSVTINADTTDLATQDNTTGAGGTLTINAPTGTPYNGQKLLFRLKSTNSQTFSWNSAFAGSITLALPTSSTGSSKYDYMGFIYNSTVSKWQLIGTTFGF